MVRGEAGEVAPTQDRRNPACFLSMEGVKGTHFHRLEQIECILDKIRSNYVYHHL